MLRIIQIVIHIVILYFFYIIGSWIQHSLNLFIPGSVIGMILLFVLLMTGLIKVTWVEAGAKFMINHLTLFFIPVTVGIMSYFELFTGRGFLLIVIVLVSTLFVMIISGHVSQWLFREKEQGHD